MFFAKVPQKWSSFLKKLLVFFDTLGGEGGVRPNVTFVTFIFFFEGVPNASQACFTCFNFILIYDVLCTLPFVVSVSLLLIFSLVIAVVLWPLASIVHALPGVDLPLSGKKGLTLGQVFESVLHSSSVHLHAKVIESGSHQPLLHLSYCLKRKR